MNITHLIASLLLMNPAYAFFDSGQRDLYECPTKADATKCKTCTKTGKVTIKVNQEKSFVLLQIKDSGTLTLENCKIIDNKNWDCSRGLKVGSGMVSEHTAILTNGQLIHASELQMAGAAPNKAYLCTR